MLVGQVARQIVSLNFGAIDNIVSEVLPHPKWPVQIWVIVTFPVKPGALHIKSR